MESNITTDEVAAVFPSLDVPIRQAIFIAVLEHRNSLLQVEVEAAKKAIANYETFVKQGEKPEEAV